MTVKVIFNFRLVTFADRIRASFASVWAVIEAGAVFKAFLKLFSVN